MRVRSIARDEVESFAAIEQLPAQSRELAQYVRESWKRGEGRPEWCFVIEDEQRRIIGRIAYWALPPSEQPEQIDLLEIPWDEGYLDVGRCLLSTSLEMLRAKGARSISYNVVVPLNPDSPVHRTYVWDDLVKGTLSKRCTLLESVGFSRIRDGLRFQWTDTPSAPRTARVDVLKFLGLPEVGDERFIDAMRRVSENTLDRNFRREQLELGGERSAREHFRRLKRLTHKPEWWQLAFEGDGELVGLVVPAANDGGPIIAYVGVVPGRRGRGHIDTLLAWGTSVLRSEGARRIRADTDVANTPMVAAFERAGYERFAKRLDYSMELPDYRPTIAQGRLAR